MTENRFPDDLMSLAETSELLGVSLRTVFRYLRAGHLRPYRDTLSNRVYVSRAQALTWVAERYEARYGERKTRG